MTEETDPKTSEENGEYGRKAESTGTGDAFSTDQVGHAQHAQLWELGITELAGHNIEAHGREEVNQMLNEGWMLLHIYTLHYEADGIWRQRPMAILGRHERADA
jgi:hypothetical protein